MYPCSTRRRVCALTSTVSIPDFGCPLLTHNSQIAWCCVAPMAAPLRLACCSPLCRLPPGPSQTLLLSVRTLHSTCLNSVDVVDHIERWSTGKSSAVPHSLVCCEGRAIAGMRSGLILVFASQSLGAHGLLCTYNLHACCFLGSVLCTSTDSNAAPLHMFNSSATAVVLVRTTAPKNGECVSISRM